MVLVPELVPAPVQPVFILAQPVSLQTRTETQVRVNNREQTHIFHKFPVAAWSKLIRQITGFTRLGIYQIRIGLIRLDF